MNAAVGRLLHPRLPEVSGAGFVIILASLAVNLAVVRMERRAGRRLASEILLSDAAHNGSDVLASVLVLASLALTRAGMTWADALTAGVIIVFIVVAAGGIVRGTLSTLSDERRIPPGDIEGAALEEPGVLEAHNVRSRGPDDDIHVDLHILVDPALPLAEGHALGHRVEDRLRRRWPALTDVVVHVEPALAGEFSVDRERGGGLRAPR